ncbi:MAG: hypothetical protein II938_01535, partial [Alphaproteobacteria bacterium]|nr:hypothetical protein [Alphaproteobacteria bacterium]
TSPDIRFTCDDPNATPDDHGVCSCNEGYVEDSEGTCIINQCINFTPTDCITACDPVTGNKIYVTLCHDNEYYCDSSHQCINPCDEEIYDTECSTCTPQGSGTDIQPTLGTCGKGGNFICSNGSCKDPCTIGSYATDDCILGWHATAGECVPDYADSTTECGTKDGYHFCNEAGECKYKPQCDSGQLYIQDKTPHCQTCAANSSVNKLTTTAEECAQCPERYYQVDQQRCYRACTDTEWRAQNGGCYSCNDTTTSSNQPPVDSQCSRCENTRFMTKAGKCMSCNVSDTDIDIKNLSDCTCGNIRSAVTKPSGTIVCRLNS